MKRGVILGMLLAAILTPFILIGLFRQICGSCDE